jgi:hypothetical protein
MLMDEQIKETIKKGNHYMDGLFAWEPGGRKGMCFFPWKSRWGCHVGPSLQATPSQEQATTDTAHGRTELRIGCQPVTISLGE